MTRIFVLPFSIKGNPYIELLYKAVESDGAYKAEPFSFARIFHALASREHVIVHIHWESNVYGSRFIARSLLRIGYRFPLLFLARFCGAKIVWTMHNLSSHEYPHPAIDRFGQRLMWILAQGVIIQNKEVAARMALAHPRVKVAYIPIATYKVYGPARPEARERTRQKFGIAKSEILLLSVGSVHSYKQPEVLIDALRGVAGVHLLIAGKCDPEYAKALRERAEGLPVTITGTFVPDSDMPDYLAASDYCIFAYDDSAMTSGAVVLGLSYGVPMILCAMPLPTREFLQEGNGFAVGTKEELPAFLRTLAARPRPSPEVVERSVAGLTWERIGREVRALYGSL